MEDDDMLSFSSNIDNDISLDDINAFLNSPPKAKKNIKKESTSSQNKKRRPASRKSPNLLDIDKWMDEITNNENTDDNSCTLKNQSKPHPSANLQTSKNRSESGITQNKSYSSNIVIDTPLGKFEQSIVNYLDCSTKDLTSVFLSELRYYIEDIFNYDHQIHVFLSQMKSEIEEVIVEQDFGMPNLHHPLDIGFYFDELSLRHSNNENENNRSLPDYHSIRNKISTAKGELQENSIPLLQKLQSEYKELIDQRIKFASIEDNEAKIHEINNIISANEYLLTIYDNEIKQLYARQTKFRQSSHGMDYFARNHDQDSSISVNEDNQQLKDSLMDLSRTLFLDKRNNCQQTRSIKNFGQKINDIKASIKDDLHYLTEKSNRLQHLNSILTSSGGLMNSQYASFNTPYPHTTYQNASITSDTSFSNAKKENPIIEDVKRRIKHVQMIRNENSKLLSNL